MKGKIIMREKIIEIIAEITMLDPENIDVEARFTELCLDSADMAEVLLEVEAVSGVEISLMEDIETVGELIEFVKDNM